MKRWPLHVARARFGEILDACWHEGPQLLTRRGVETAVLVSLEQWQSITRVEKPTLKDLLLTDMARANLPAPLRGHRRRRTVRVPM
jgi:prevent-host-death family protein